MSKIRWISFPSFPCKDWKIAECSLSTGRMETPFCFANGIIICPAVTSVSLFASAISLPASIAAIVGRTPSIPTMAVTKISDSASVATAIKPSMPYKTSIFKSAIRFFSSDAESASPTDTNFGLNSRICFSNKSIFRPQDIDVTIKSPCSLTISKVCVPMEPVEPRIAIFFINRHLYYIKIVAR